MLLFGWVGFRRDCRGLAVHALQFRVAEFLIWRVRGRRPFILLFTVLLVLNGGGFSSQSGSLSFNPIFHFSSPRSLYPPPSPPLTKLTSPTPQDLRDLTRSLMKIHHTSAVRSVVFSSSVSTPLQIGVGLDNGSVYRCVHVWAACVGGIMKMLSLDGWARRPLFCFTLPVALTSSCTHARDPLPLYFCTFTFCTDGTCKRVLCGTWTACPSHIPGPY